MAEDFIDRNGNGIWDPSEPFTDSDGNGQWDGPELIKKLVHRDGDYWLEPEMYENYEPFYDYESVNLLWQNVPGYFGTPSNRSFTPVIQTRTITCQMPQELLGMRAEHLADTIIFMQALPPSQMKLDLILQAQITDKWKIRAGIDYKSHKLNFYEVKYPG